MVGYLDMLRTVPEARASFTVRVWREADVIWRGQVVHVQTGRTAFFQAETQFWEFVRACLGLRAEEPFLGYEPAGASDGERDDDDITP